MNNLNLPANYAMMNETEMTYTVGGFELKDAVPFVAAGAAVIAVGALALNMLSWATGNRDTNFIQDTINLGGSFIQGSINVGSSFLNDLMGINQL